MLRLFYRWLLSFHPARFRKRFAEEMLSIFDHIEGRAAAVELVADAFISLVRQWTMRSEYWEEKATVSRSEEHTSELQSRLHLVCRLLLEKKKKDVPSSHKPDITKNNLHITCQA